MQGQKYTKKYTKILPGPNTKIPPSCHNVYATPEAKVNMRFTHVNQLKTPRFRLLQLNALQQQDLSDVNGPIVQMLNIGVRMMGGNLKMVFSVFFMPMDIANVPNA